MSKDSNMIPFYKNHGFIGEWSNVIESTYDLLRILEYCVSNEMNYTPEAKQQIQELIDWLRAAANVEGQLTDASNYPGGLELHKNPIIRDSAVHVRGIAARERVFRESASDQTDVVANHGFAPPHSDISE